VFAGWRAASTAIERRKRLIATFAAAIGVIAGRIRIGRITHIRTRSRADPGWRSPICCADPVRIFSNRRRSIDRYYSSGGGVRINPRGNGWIDCRNVRSEVDVGGTHQALRMNRRTVQSGKCQHGGNHKQYQTPSCCPPIHAIVDHRASNFGAHARSAKILRLEYAEAPVWRMASRCREREADNLLALQFAHQVRNCVLSHRAVAKLKPERAILHVDNRGVITFEQRGDLCDLCVRRETNQGARRRADTAIAGCRLVRA